MFLGYISSAKMLAQSDISLEALEIAGNQEFDKEKFLKPYQDELMKLMKKSRFTSEGAALVDSQRGKIAAKKTTVVLKADDLNACLYEISRMIYEDQSLRDFLDTLYAPMSKTFGYDLTELVLSQLSDEIGYMEVYDDMAYSIYTNNAGLILQHEIKTNEYDEGTITLSTVGKGNLLNEIYVGVTDGEDVFKLSAVGNHIPVNGVYSSKINARTITQEETDYGTTATVETNLFDLSYRYDMTRSVDNFQMTLGIGQYQREEYTTEYPYDYNMSIQGDIAISAAAKSISYNFSKINFNFAGYSEGNLDISTSFGFRPADTAGMGYPKDKAVEPLKLTEEEAQIFMEEILQINY